MLCACVCVRVCAFVHVNMRYVGLSIYILFSLDTNSGRRLYLGSVVISFFSQELVVMLLQLVSHC